MTQPTIVLAGATGDLGGRIARALRHRGASVKAIVRRGAARERVERIGALGCGVTEVDFASRSQLTDACAGGACVVSALSGLRDVVVGAQSALLDAAVGAGVPRFIPSDYSLDFTRLAAGTNRNFDWRREFHALLDAAPVAVTSIFNGAFAELLTGKAPILLFKIRRVVYWEDADQRMDFTTMDDTADYAAAAALDPEAPRALHVAGDSVSARELASIAGDVSGNRFRLLRAGRLARLDRLIKVARALVPGDEQVFPPWQGMQYLRDMFGGRAKVDPLDNDRYPGIRWTPVREVLAARFDRRLPARHGRAQVARIAVGRRQT